MYIIEDLIKTVQICLEEGRPFSAYNITILTRERKQIKLRHKEIVGIVHELDVIQDALDYGYTMADQATYSWSKTEFNNWSGSPFQVYHPVGYDVNKDFVPEGVAPLTQNVIQSSVRPDNMIGQITPDADGTQKDAGGEQKDGTFKVDCKNRLLVPTRFLREANISAGEEVYITSLSDPGFESVFISKNVLELGLTATLKKVERYGDIRIHKCSFESANIINEVNFAIKVEDSVVFSQKMIKITKIK